MPKDSDVQACWSADHDVQLRTLKLGFRQRQRFLDERVKHGLLDEPSEAKTWLGRWQLGQLVGVHVERWGLRMRKSSRVFVPILHLKRRPWEASGHLPPLRLPSPQISLPDLGPARLLHPRRHVACVVVDSGSPDVPGLERQVWQLLQAARGVDWKILLLWFGHSSAASWRDDFFVGGRLWEACS